MKKPTFQEFTKWVIVSAIIALLTGCGTARQVTQVVHDTRVDTVYLRSQQYDSIYIYHNRDKDYRKGITNHSSLIPNPDTVLIREVVTEYRYKLLRDTVRIVERDSIPYEVRIVETKEITRPLTWFDYLTRFCFFFLMGVIACWIYNRFGIFKH